MMMRDQMTENFGYHVEFSETVPGHEGQVSIVLWNRLDNSIVDIFVAEDFDDLMYGFTKDYGDIRQYLANKKYLN